MMQIETITQVTDELVNAFRRLIPLLSSSAPAPSKQELAEIVNSPATVLFIARDSGPENSIVGTLTLVLYRVPTGVHAYIEDVVVDTNARGQGVGEALTRAAIRRAAEAGTESVDLTSRPSREAANRLYQRIGFVKRETNVYRYTIAKDEGGRQ